METTLSNPVHFSPAVFFEQPRWQSLLLLSILCYEGLGALAGGFMLIARPDGAYMQLPVQIMHGVFDSFLLPGIVLFGVGLINMVAFFSLLQRRQAGWQVAGLALLCLVIWFVTEIIILQELHWLHAMWGLPVLLGIVLLMPLIATPCSRYRVRTILLMCGMLSSLWYLIINIVVPMRDPYYNAVTQTISELSAFDAPTRILWVMLATVYPLLYAAFGWGIWLFCADRNKPLRIVAVLSLIYAVLNFYWPPMHVRELLAAGGGTWSDTLHITWAMITLVFNVSIMGFAAAGLGRPFRQFTLLCFLFFVLFGIPIGIEAPGIGKNTPTPFIGIWERLNIAFCMGWVIVLSISLLKRKDLSN